MPPVSFPAVPSPSRPRPPPPPSPSRAPPAAEGPPPPPTTTTGWPHLRPLILAGYVDCAADGKVAYPRKAGLGGGSSLSAANPGRTRPDPSRFTEEKARFLGLRTSHVAKYHSAIASRLANLGSGRTAPNRAEPRRAAPSRADPRPHVVVPFTYFQCWYTAQEMGPRVGVLIFVLAAMVLATASSPRLYEWTVKYEYTSPESSKMLSITINGQSPGPIISVYQGDKFIVDLTNGLGNENLEIQWEGVRQIGEAQGPVLPGNTTRFQFVADQLGTNSYYAVSKLQRVAGLQGSIQVLPQPIEGKEGVPFAEGADKEGKGKR